MGVVVVAAGSGARRGAGRPQAVGERAGAPLLAHALRGVLEAEVDEVVVVAPNAHVADAQDVVDRCGTARVVVVGGGAERTDSVAAGLAALSEGVGAVLVHDAARCLTPASVFERVLTALAIGAKGVVPGVPVVDTIKLVGPGGAVAGTPPRESLRAVQTPQGFDREVLAAAHASGTAATDDAALVEALGHRVVVVDGDERALKITTPEDLERARRLFAARP